MKQHKRVIKIFRTLFIGCTLVAVSTAAASQTVPQKSDGQAVLDNMTKVFAVLSTILGLCVGALQLYIANKIAKVREEFNTKIELIKSEFYTALSKESVSLENKIEATVDKIENRVATKADMQSMKEMFALSMKNLEQTMQLHTKEVEMKLLKTGNKTQSFNDDNAT